VQLTDYTYIFLKLDTKKALFFDNPLKNKEEIPFFCVFLSAWQLCGVLRGILIYKASKFNITIDPK